MNQKLETALKIPKTALPRVVIIGGGFGGIKLVKKLKNKGFQLVMIDRHNYHTFQPLLYQVATAGLEPDSIAGPLRKVFDRHKNFYFRMAEVLKVFPAENKIQTSIGDIDYDYLVIATGSKTNWFGNEDIRKNAFPLKEIPQALDLRSHLLQNFEKALLIDDPVEKESLTNFVIVGGGPTGVEVAGALGELKKHVLPKDYPELELSKMKIYLAEGTSRLLGAMSESSSEKVLKYLKKFQVEVLLERLVKSYDGQKVVLNDGAEVLTQTLIWAAGVEGNSIQGLPESSAAPGKRIRTDVYARVEGCENIYAVGDAAAIITADTPKGHPMLAPVAMQQGELLAKNLVNSQKNKPLKPFKYRDKGSMATVGRNKAVVELPGFKFGGIFAWFVWMFVHLISIIGFRGKLIVVSNWIWNYFTYDRGTRLIIRPFKRKGK